MSESPDTPDTPSPAEESPPQSSRIGVDSWVAESEGRRSRTPGALLGRGWERTPDALKLLAFVGVASSVPFWTSEADLYSFGLFTLLYVAVAMGLNVVVGLAGLLDLGYVAYYGIGAYTYAELSSPKYNLHWPAEATLPIAMAAAAIAGLILGMSSRRLLGDYFAIVTLFFGEAFVFVTNVSDPWGFTGGANGIAPVDPIRFSLYYPQIHPLRSSFHLQHYTYVFASTKQLYFLLLIVVAFLAMAIHFANQSRTGRAWRSQREDPLAAEAMSTPVNRVKILAAVVGAAIAGLAGAIYCAINTSAVATNFSVSVLIIFYAIIILGGLGSIAGVIVGAVVINGVFEYLQPTNSHPEVKRWLFYGMIVLLVLLIKPVIRPVLVLAATVGFGFAVHAIVAATAGAAWTTGIPLNNNTGLPVAGGTWISKWVVIPYSPHGNFNNYIYIGLVVAVVVVASLKGWWRMAALVPTLYLVALAWENVLVQNGGVTAFLLLGAVLIGLMTTRPQGMLGAARVEII
jgi:branched-chain amino acid transport system permease protein